MNWHPFKWKVDNPAALVKHAREMAMIATEPTQGELDKFIELLQAVPPFYFGPYEEDSADYGTEFTAAIRCRIWLDAIADSGLLRKDSP